MSGALYWFLLAQTVSGLPAFADGTEVRIVSMDLLRVYAVGRVSDGTLRFDAPLRPGTRVRVLVFPPDASDAARAEALSGAGAFDAIVPPSGDDLMTTFPEVGGPVSLRAWLSRERGVALSIPSP